MGRQQTTWAGAIQKPPGYCCVGNLSAPAAVLIAFPLQGPRARLYSAVDSGFQHLPTDEQSSNQFVLAAPVLVACRSSTGEQPAGQLCFVCGSCPAGKLHFCQKPPAFKAFLISAEGSHPVAALHHLPTPAPTDEPTLGERRPGMSRDLQFLLLAFRHCNPLIISS